MPTSFTFGANFAATSTGSSIFNGGGTINAVVDDGDVAVGDLVSLGGFTTSTLNLASITGGDAYYLGTTVINGHQLYIFGEANTVGGNTEFLAVADTSAAANSGTSGALAVWAGSPTPLSMDNACFAAGSLISTPQGATAVEDLAIGDMITTVTGGLVPVKWVGRQTIGKFWRGAAAQMVRIRAGALGVDVPHSDLTVTADHGMAMDGCVVNASALVNGDSIDWVPLCETPERFIVYHIETEAHDVILANGAASETYLDIPGRRAFDNYAEYEALYGPESPISENPMPRIASARLLPQTIRTRLGLLPEGVGSFPAASHVG